MSIAQNTGKVPKLCETNGPFMTAVRDCKACYDYHAKTGSQAALAATVEPNYKQFIDYCSALSPATALGAASSPTSVLAESAAAPPPGTSSTLINNVRYYRLF